jgi:hypothetical protein
MKVAQNQTLSRNSTQNSHASNAPANIPMSFTQQRHMHDLESECIIPKDTQAQPIEDSSSTSSTFPEFNRRGRAKNAHPAFILLLLLAMVISVVDGKRKDCEPLNLWINTIDDADCCDLDDGITCANNGDIHEMYVSSITKFSDFTGRGLEGTIPWSSLMEIPKLKSINLSDNGFTGSISDIPDLLVTNLDKLESIDLSDNNLTGTIPESIITMLTNLAGTCSLTNNPGLCSDVSFTACGAISGL